MDNDEYPTLKAGGSMMNYLEATPENINSVVVLRRQEPAHEGGDCGKNKAGSEVRQRSSFSLPFLVCFHWLAVPESTTVSTVGEISDGASDRNENHVRGEGEKHCLSLRYRCHSAKDSCLLHAVLQRFSTLSDDNKPPKYYTRVDKGKVGTIHLPARLKR